MKGSKPISTDPPQSPDLSTRWTRRVFLGGVATAATAAAWRFLLNPIVLGDSEESSPGDLLHAAIAKLQLDPRAGESYLDSMLGVSAFELGRRLTNRLRSTSDSASTENELFRRVAMMVREDFQAGRLLRGDEWECTELEAQLAALRALADLGPTERLDLGTWRLEEFCDLQDWGPQSATRGRGFNTQPDGSSAFWFEHSGEAPPLEVRFGETLLQTNQQTGLITAGMSVSQVKQATAAATTVPVALVHSESGTSQLAGFFHVVPANPAQPFESAPLDLSIFIPDTFLKILEWGPQETPVGQPFNSQQDGRSALWIRTGGELPAGVFLTLAGLPLPTIPATEGVLTAGLVRALTRRLTATSAKLPLDILDPATRRIQKVGTFEVHLDS